MSYFKRFTDAGSGFACFMAWIHLFGQYMTYTFPEDTEGMREKIKLFLSKTDEYDNLLLFILGALFLLSALCGRLLAAYPHAAAVLTLPPLALTFDMVRSEYIKEYPMLYVFFGVMATAGCICECVALDRENGGYRAGLCGSALSASACLFFATVYSRWLDMSALEDGSALHQFDYAIYSGSETTDMRLFLIFAVVFGGLAIVQLLHRDIYFIDAILALPPFIAMIYKWNAETFDIHAELALVFAGAVLGARLIAMLSGRSAVRRTAVKEDCKDVY